RRAAVAVVPAVRDPLADVALKIMQPECIGREAARRGRAPVAVVVAFEGVAPAAPPRGTVGTAGQVAGAGRRRTVAPGVAAGATGAQCVLELGLARQPVPLPAHLRQPVHV